VSIKIVIDNKVILFVKYGNVDRHAIFTILKNAALRERS